MKAGLAQREPARLEQWESSGLYQRLTEYTKDRPLFILHDGPPYANGDIHLGHAVNKILKDMVIRSRLLSGFNAPYVPGWDCHGLPIELKVEKKVGKVGRKIDAHAFRKACREYAAKQIDGQCKDFKRLGVLGDWERPYRSMDFAFEANMLRALSKIYERGHIVKGVKPVHWCFDCGSALAEAEIEYQDKVSPAIDVKFDAVDSAALHQAFGLHDDTPVAIVIWTTTPWTLPANQAVTLGAEIEYDLVEADGARLVLAKELVESVTQRAGCEQITRLATTTGEKLEHLRLQHPFNDRDVPVILGDHVTLDAGTGAVHTAPGHGQEDFEVGAKYKLPITNPVAGNGLFVEDTPLVGGQNVFKSNETIIDILRDHGALLHVEDYEHSYPHCWRHKTPTAFRVTPQWFISMDHKRLRSRALDLIDEVEWIPGFGKARIHSMIEQRPDWCISRQRTWGVPIALFVHNETDEPHPDSVRVMREVADRVETGGVDVWYDIDARELIGDDADHYRKVTDILDVWFDSGVTHQAVLEAYDGLQRPADIYLEGSDQHRGWFQSSLLTSAAIDGSAPYRKVLTHGFTVDADGKKMSKSLGNTMSPQKVAKNLGADIIRLWVSANDYRYEMTVSEEVFKRVADTYRRIRNTARFLLGNLDGFTADDLLPTDDLLPLDRWAIDAAWQVQQKVVDAYDEFQYLNVYQGVHQFCSQTLGSFYLDIIKDRLYTMPANSQGRRSAQTAMWHIVHAMSRWLAPILAFTADEIWEHFAGGDSDSVLFETWYEELETLPEGAKFNREFFDRLRQVRDVVNRELEHKRAAGELRGGLDADVTIFADPALKTSLDALGEELRFFTITSEADTAPIESTPADSNHHMVDDHAVSVQVAVSTAKKCERCWHRRPSVGVNPEHPTICDRCITNLGVGEQRQFG